MSASAIFGREQQLAAADAFLGAAHGGFSVLRLHGEPGIGKTTVWREVIRQARSRDFRVLACRPAQAETKLALSGLADLIEPVESEMYSGLPPPQRHALEVALLRAEPARTGDGAGSGPDPRALATAVRSLLVRLSADGPLLVAVDDVQWLDPGSAGIIQFVLRRLGGTRMGWLFAARLPEPGWLADGGVVPPESQAVARLGPLPLSAIHRMLKERADEPLTRPALLRVHQASAGNPLFALEIARALRTSPGAGAVAPLGVPAGLRGLLADRIPALSATAQAALLCAAALSHPTVDLVEQASSAPGLAAAEETGLVRVEAGRVVFAHPLYASAVYEAASRARRSELHLHLAGLVRDAEERARHLALATSRADENVARTLEAGAAVARSRGAWESAADLFERARALTPADSADAGHRRGIDAAQCHVHAGERSRGRELLTGILAGPLPRPLRADALRLLAEISYNEDRAAEARDLYEEAFAQTDDPRRLLRIELGLSYLSGQLADHDAGARHAYQALARAEALGDQSLLAPALALCAMFDFLLGRGVNWAKVRRSLALENRGVVMPVLWHPSSIAAILLLYVGQHAEARERLTQVWTEALDRGDESDLSFIGLWRSWLETRSGNFAAALALADEAVSLASLTGSEAMRKNLLAQRALVHACRGEAAQALADCAEAATSSEHSWVVVWVAAARATLELSRGDAAAAWAACQEVTEAVEQHGIAEPVPVFFLPDAIEALIALGELNRAETLLGAFEARGREVDRAWALATGGRCRGLLLAARGELGGAAAALEQALAQHDRLDMPLERARTLLARGIVGRRARKTARARGSLELAIGICEECGAALWSRRAQEELGKLGARRAPGGELTDAEWRVAEASARGLTNRETAAALFLSPKTVEAHLSSIYRKLGVHSRAALGAYMAEHAPDAGNT
jgi:DNA-binding CsgD family transcriptional regulator